MKVETVSTEKKTGLYWLWLSVVVVILDQFVKYLVSVYFVYNEAFYLLPFLNLTLAHNTGAAFSFLSETGLIAVWLFIITAFIISLVLGIWMYRLSPKNYWLGVSLALILGGAVGNLLDRIFFGYVIDFIHFHLGTWSFPIFNIADVAITIGAFMLIIDLFKKN